MSRTAGDASARSCSEPPAGTPVPQGCPPLLETVVTDQLSTRERRLILDGNIQDGPKAARCDLAHRHAAILYVCEAVKAGLAERSRAPYKFTCRNARRYEQGTHNCQEEAHVIDLPLTFMLHQVRPSADHNSSWHGRIELLDLDVDGFAQLPETLSLIRSTVRSIGRDLESVDLVDTVRGAVGPVDYGHGGGHAVKSIAESRRMTITAHPEDAFRRLIFRRRLIALQRQVIERSIVWRQTPEVPDDSTAPWVRSLRDMEDAIDRLVAWQRESADLPS